VVGGKLHQPVPQLLWQGGGGEEPQPQPGEEGLRGRSVVFEQRE
jgi:hypothetical protein